YRAVAPNFRGFGNTDAPPSITSYTCLHVVGDMVALIGSLSVDQAFLVAHDWGAMEPGKMESEIAKYGAAAVIKKILTDRKPGPPILPKQNPFGNLRDIDDIKLPAWFSDEDLKYYASKYNHNGFTGGLNYYRALDLNWELTAAWTGVQIKIPVKFIVRGLDMMYTTPGMKEYVHGGGFKNDVPLLKECVVIQGAGHFINQERAEEVNAHIHEFIKEFSTF
ncbi:bifunctional epoxide hydrolase 2-like, partial [Olea europaea subsp. europaea]